MRSRDPIPKAACQRKSRQDAAPQLTLGGGTESVAVLVELFANPDRLANRSEMLSRSPRASSGPVDDIIDVTLLILLTSDGFLRSKAAISLIDVDDAPCPSSCSVSVSPFSDEPSADARSESSSTSRIEAGRPITSVISLPALHVCERGRSRCA